MRRRYEPRHQAGWRRAHPRIHRSSRLCSFRPESVCRRSAAARMENHHREREGRFPSHRHRRSWHLQVRAIAPRAEGRCRKPVSARLRTPTMVSSGFADIRSRPQIQTSYEGSVLKSEARNFPLKHHHASSSPTVYIDTAAFTSPRPTAPSAFSRDSSHTVPSPIFRIDDIPPCRRARFRCIGPGPFPTNGRTAIRRGYPSLTAASAQECLRSCSIRWQYRVAQARPMHCRLHATRPRSLWLARFVR